jgi:nicotinamidase/pyrazinamidase
MKTVYFDIDTQLDFLYPAGALYAPGAEQIVGAVAALNRHAAQSREVVMSTMDAHAEDDAEFRIWPGHCVAGTLGQRKPESTLLSKRLVIPSIDLAERVDGIEQVLLEKQHLDCFTNPNLEWLLEAFGADRYVVYGVVTEYCVKFAAMGLLKTGKRVEVVTDAIRSLREEDGRAILDEFRSSGGVAVTVSEVLN